MKRKQQNIDESRRRLLGGAVALGVVGAGIGALGITLAPRIAHVQFQAEKPESRGYRETDHIRQYYRTTA